jgi:hypothetical protein
LLQAIAHRIVDVAILLAAGLSPTTGWV